MLFAVLGCVVAIVLTYEDFHPRTDIGCSRLGGDCAKTLSSKYGHLGPIPTSIFGLGMYLIVAAACLKRRNQIQIVRDSELEPIQPEAEPAALGDDEPSISEEPSPTASQESPHISAAAIAHATLRRLDTGIWYIAIAGVVISFWLQYVSLFEICSFCPWCFGSAILITLIFLVSSYDHLIAGKVLDSEQKLLTAVSTFIFLCFAFVATPVISQRIRMCGVENLTPPLSHPKDRSLIVKDYLKWKGPADAKYMMIEFADYECSHCRLAAGRIDKMLDRQPPGGVKFAFRNFPLDRHHWARQAALAAEAAGEQGKFWEMHDLIFKDQDKMTNPGFSRESIDLWAAELGLDMKRFSKDFDSHKIGDRVSDDRAAGMAIKLVWTPTILLVTPTQITMFSGLDDFARVWTDPSSPEWK